MISGPEHGFNVTGYFRAESGVGEGVRLLTMALEAASVPYTTLEYTDVANRQGHPFEARGSGRAPYDINIVAINADVTPVFAAKVGPDFFFRRYTIGEWNWETETLPKIWHSGLDHVDEVWLSSNYSAEAVRRVTSKPVFTFALPIIRPKLTDEFSRADLGLPDGYLFLFTFDYFGGFRRKNPVGVVEAFKKAFSDGEGPILVLKSVNGDREADEMEELRLAIGGRGDIRVIDGYLPVAQKNSLVGFCDCYVSLHRSEGFGLTIAEAMSLGKPAIATGYSGNVDFMTDDNSYLVGWKPALVGRDRFFPPDDRWSEPDIEDGARLMRYVYEHQDEARNKGARAERDIREQHSPESRAGFLRERLHDISTNRLERAFLFGTGSQYRYDVHRIEKLLMEGPTLELPTRFGGPYGAAARRFRRYLRRFLHGYELRQREVDLGLLRLIGELEARQRVAMEEARRGARPDAAESR
jgi:glycosyltransferase involved in cell wall biosynthesis